MLRARPIAAIAAGGILSIAVSACSSSTAPSWMPQWMTIKPESHARQAASMEPPKDLTAAQTELRGAPPTQMETASAGSNGVALQYEANADACMQKVFHNPSYIALKGKTAIDDTEKYSFTMLYNWNHPNQEEVVLLSRLYEEYRECRKLFMESISLSRPNSLNAIAQNNSKSDTLWAEATNGKLTWGEFNRGRVDLGIERRQLLYEIKDHDLAAVPQR